jgi:iron complex outermembrane receptor protein
MTDYFRGTVYGLVAGLLIWSHTVVAQGIEEMVVTTRKVEENLQNVPVAVTAFSAKLIEEARIENLDDVASLTPGLSFFNPFGEHLPVPVIRGVAPTDIFGDPNAAVYIDGVYAAGREGLNFSLLNIERIEVNKGPQSSLYGRNAFSGAINYITKRPTDEFSSYVELTGGNRDRYTAKVGMSVPVIGNTLGLGIGVGYDTWAGSYDNPVSNEDVGGHTFNTITASLDWRPTDGFEALLNVYYSDDEIDSAAMTGQVADCENVGPDDGTGRRYANLCGEVWDLDQVRAAYNQGIVGSPNVPAELQFTTGSEEIAVIAGSEGEEREVTRVSLNLDWDLDFGTITALTGYSRVEHEGTFDFTFGLGYAYPFVYCEDVIDYVDPPDNSVPICTDFNTPLRFTSGQLLVLSRPDITKEISQELRFTSAQERAIRYSVGGYYFLFESNNIETSVVSVAPSLPDGLGDPTGPGTPPPGAAFGPFPGIGLAIGDPAYRSWFDPNRTLGSISFVDESETESYAIFATLDWSLTERLTADFQLRYTLEQKNIKAISQIVSITREVDVDFDFWTGRAGLSYSISDDWMVYTAISNGAKAGGFSFDEVEFIAAGTGLVEPGIVIAPYKEEKIVSYELGLKGTTSDGRFRYDSSMYLLNWTDIIIPQVFENDPISGQQMEQPESFNANAGDATVWGWEMQGDIAFTDNVFGGFGMSFTDATMDNAQLASFTDLPSFAPDGDVSGNKLLRQPEWQANANVRYVQPLNDTWEFDTRADVVYQDEYFGGLDNQWTIPGHTYVNLRFALVADRWSISLWAKNLFNDDAPVAAFRDVYLGNTDDVLQQQPASATPQKFFPWRITTSHPRLRTFGLTASVRFGAVR